MTVLVANRSMDEAPASIGLVAMDGAACSAAGTRRNSPAHRRQHQAEAVFIALLPRGEAPEHHPVTVPPPAARVTASCAIEAMI